MPLTARRPAALMTALLVIAFGVAYLLQRPDRWTSTAAIVLVPSGARVEDRATIIESFARSGITGTAVEYLSGPEVWRRAGRPVGDLEVRAVPDTRVIDLTLTGPERRRVTGDLDEVLRTGVDRQSELGDPWRMQILAPASDPEHAGPAAPLVLGATVLLALMAALAVWSLPVRPAPSAAEDEAVLGAVADHERRQAA